MHTKQITTYKVLRTYRLLRFLMVMYLIFSPVLLHADALTEPEVRAAVQIWVRHVTADSDPDTVIEEMEPYIHDGEIVAYIAHLVGGGFCLCGADDLVLPVYLYSPEGIYDPDNPDYQFILWEIEVRTKQLTQAVREKALVFQQHEQALASRAFFWQALITGIVPEKREGLEGLLAEPDLMELNLTSQWRQGSPYNDQCPDLLPGSGNHTLVGCVATAMSQIMYYWQWPPTGVGNSKPIDYDYRWRTNWDEEPLATDPGITPYYWDGRLEWTATAGGRLRMNGNWDNSVFKAARSISNDGDYRSALNILYNRLNFGTTTHEAHYGVTTYDWSILQDTHTDPPDAGDAEVAKLCYHVGLSVDMGYGIWGSGTSTSEVPTALEDHFRYDPDATYVNIRDIDKMTEDIQWLRPLQIRGCKPQAQGGGCHAWIVYGYNKGTDPDREFLMNLGWGPGSSHVWYTLDSVQLAYTLDQQHATQLAPLDVVKFVGDDNTGDGSPDDPYEDVEEAIVDAPDGVTLIFKAGSTNTFSSSPLVINRPFTLKGYNVTIQKQ
jgi:hypothetical protein